MEDIANRRLNRDLITVQQNAKELDQKNITSIIRDVDDPAISQNERSYPLNNDIGHAKHDAAAAAWMMNKYVSYPTD